MEFWFESPVGCLVIWAARFGAESDILDNELKAEKIERHEEFFNILLVLELRLLA